MRIQDRGMLIGLALAAYMPWSAASLPAQEPNMPKAAAPRPEAPPVRRGYDPSRRLPNYYGQIGLTPEQRESIYKILGKHQEKLEAQRKQIAELRSEMMKECESVLTDPQKQLLETRRRAPAREPERTATTSLKTPGQ
jgi:Spy/CpxP family protein refolding chaperone